MGSGGKVPICGHIIGVEAGEETVTDQGPHASWLHTPVLSAVPHADLSKATHVPRVQESKIPALSTTRCRTKNAKGQNELGTTSEVCLGSVVIL